MPAKKPAKAKKEAKAKQGNEKPAAKAVKKPAVKPEEGLIEQEKPQMEKVEAKPKPAEKEVAAAEKKVPGQKKVPDQKGTGGAGKDPWKVINFPHLAEKSMNMVEFDNKLTFIVRKSATKKEIKEAVEKLFDVKVLRVQTEVTPKGVKKAYAKLGPEHSASEIASRMGMV